MGEQIPGREHGRASRQRPPALGGRPGGGARRDRRASSPTIGDDVEPDRVLATLLVTDIVAPAGGGGRRPRLADLLALHVRLVRAELARFRGRELELTAGRRLSRPSTGPPGPSAAPRRSSRRPAAWVSRCAPASTPVRSSRSDDERARDRRRHRRARSPRPPRPGEVLVSSTVKDIVAGSGIAFEERGEHELDGVPGTWRLFR